MCSVVSQLENLHYSIKVTTHSGLRCSKTNHYTCIHCTSSVSLLELSDRAVHERPACRPHFLGGAAPLELQSD